MQDLNRKIVTEALEAEDKHIGKKRLTAKAVTFDEKSPKTTARL